MLNQNNISAHSSQAVNLLNLISSKLHSQNLRIQLRSLPRKERKAFDGLLYYHSKYGKSTSIAQETIAKKAEAVRETINRYIAKWEMRGWITKIYRHRKTCFYDLSPIFYNLDFRRTLQDVFKSFRVLPFSLLLYTRSRDIEKVTPTKERNLIYKSSSLPSLPTSRSQSPIIVISVENPKRKIANMTDLQKRISEHLRLKESDISSLADFGEDILDSAFQRVKAVKELRSPAGYFFTICRDMKAKKVSGISVNKKLTSVIENPKSREQYVAPERVMTPRVKQIHDDLKEKIRITNVALRWTQSMLKMNTTAVYSSAQESRHHHELDLEKEKTLIQDLAFYEFLDKLETPSEQAMLTLFQYISEHPQYLEHQETLKIKKACEEHAIKKLNAKQMLTSSKIDQNSPIPIQNIVSNIMSRLEEKDSPNLKFDDLYKAKEIDYGQLQEIEDPFLWE